MKKKKTKDCTTKFETGELIKIYSWMIKDKDRVSLEGVLEAPFKPATPYEEITTNEAGIAGLKAIDDACEPYNVQFVGEINFKFKRGGMAYNPLEFPPCKKKG